MNWKRFSWKTSRWFFKTIHIVIAWIAFIKKNTQLTYSPKKIELIQRWSTSSQHGFYIYECWWVIEHTCFCRNIYASIRIVIDHSVVMIPKNECRCFSILYNAAHQFQCTRWSQISNGWTNNFSSSLCEEKKIEKPCDQNGDKN